MKRQKHNLSNYRLTTTDMGKLIPVQCIDVLPGDTMQLETSALIRVSPMLAPVMHPCTVRFHHWFVPYRILWDGFEDFITGGEDGNNADALPQLAMTSNDVEGELADHLGINPTEGSYVSALPFRAYNKIYNEFYRDQDLENEVGEDTRAIRNVSWRKDYFTASRPFAQKGHDITLPVGDVAPVYANTAMADWMQQNGTAFNMVAGENSDWVETKPEAGDGVTPSHIQDGYLEADLSQATGITAREFREFFALQRFAEARARYGSRYTEYLAYMGVQAQDGRLQRPEYLGGGKQNLQFSEVLQTADTPDGQDNDGVVGTMRGHGITALKTRRTRKFFQEHGVVLTLMSVVPKSIYVDGTPRMFLKEYRDEFFQKELQSIGQQEVYLGEVYSTGGVNDRDTFGYTDRYNEYTWQPSQVSGEFRSILDYWHLGRKFESTPALNPDFIRCNPSKRIFAEQTQNSLWCMINNKVVSRRLVKKQSIGRLM